jgi:CheY-like chemotaxis protein
VSHPAHQPQTILVIEDEAQILAIVQTLLEGEGYRVLVASRPAVGLKLYAEHWPSIQLVLTDYMMPEMTGDKVFAALKQINLRVKVILVTGSGDYSHQDLIVQGLRGCVRKPFHLDEIVAKVKEVIESEG